MDSSSLRKSYGENLDKLSIPLNGFIRNKEPEKSGLPDSFNSIEWILSEGDIISVEFINIAATFQFH